jgi:hypothetical protein
MACGHWVHRNQSCSRRSTSSQERYEQTASAHVSAELKNAPTLNEVSNRLDLLDHLMPAILRHLRVGTDCKTATGDFRFFDRFMDVLYSHPEAYAQYLERHFIRHLTPFVMD